MPENHLPSKPGNGLVLRVNGRAYCLREGLRLTVKDIPGLATQVNASPLAEVCPHPTDASIFGLKNLSLAPWTATLAGGEQRTVDPGRSVRLAPGTRVRFGTAEATIVAGSGSNAYRLETNGRSWELTSGLTLTDKDLTGAADGVVAEVVRNPLAPAVLGLKNVSGSMWKSTVGAVPRDVAPGQTVRLEAGMRVSFDTTEGTVLSQPPFRISAALSALRHRIVPRSRRAWLALAVAVALVVVGATVGVLLLGKKPGDVVVADTIVDPKAGMNIALSDGSQFVFPPYAFKEPTRVTITEMATPPGFAGSNGVVGPIYDVKLGEDGQAKLRRAVQVSLPMPAGAKAVHSDRGELALASWDGDSWGPVASNIDEKKGRISADVAGFSPKAVIWTERWKPGPARVVLSNLGADKRTRFEAIPRGSQVVVCVEGAGIESYAGGTVEILREWGTAAAKVADVRGEFTDNKGQVRRRVYPPAELGALWFPPESLEFSLLIPRLASLGLRDIRITKDDLEPLVFKKAFQVCAPLVVIVDIDGMRPDALFPALEFPERGCENLRKLVGTRQEGKVPFKHPELNGTPFEHASWLWDAVTVYPTVTFAGHAGIFTGLMPAQLNMAGNEWFDRTSVPRRKFAFTGDNIGVTGGGDSIPSFRDGVANNRLREKCQETVYEVAARGFGLTSAAIHIMYYGDGDQAAKWLPAALVPDLLEYYFRGTAHLDDSAMIDKACGVIREQKGLQGYDHLGVMTLYYASLDHICHEGGPDLWAKVMSPFGGGWTPIVEGPNGKQALMLRYCIDPYLGRFLSALNDAQYKSAIFVVTGDHAQTTMEHYRGMEDADLYCFARSRTIPKLHKFQDLLWELGYVPNGNLRAAGELPYEAMSAVVGLNGGMAHVYLRRLHEFRALEAPDNSNPSKKPPEEFLKKTGGRFDSWVYPPSFEEVLHAAEWFWRNLGQTPTGGAPPYLNSLAMILIRDSTAKPGEPGYDYRVYHPTGLVSYSPLTFADYLQSDEGQKFLKDHLWSTKDIPFLNYRLQKGLNGPMSGDLILVPRYPTFYTEYEPLFGDHGSFRRTDFQVPLMVACAGADEKKMAWIKDVLDKTIDLKAPKDRPSNTDVKGIVLGLLPGYDENVPGRSKEGRTEGTDNPFQRVP